MKVKLVLVAGTNKKAKNIYCKVEHLSSTFISNKIFFFLIISAHLSNI
jgi:hypothetical protein